MNKLRLLIFFILTSTSAFANSPHKDLWLDLKADFDAKPFFNANINDFRDGVMSPYTKIEYGSQGYNNAHPLTSQQLRKIPEAQFVPLKVFHLAMEGRAKLLKAKKIPNYSWLAISDFDQSSKHRRFYIIDLKNKEVFMNTWVSHATGSDPDNDGIPTVFSNVSGSNLSSVGFFTTKNETYQGTYGYSLRMNGLDSVLNSRAFARAIVFHKQGNMGAHNTAWGSQPTSQGCLMLPMIESGRFWGLEVDEPLYRIAINTLKQGALIFTYTGVKENGKFLLEKSDWLGREDFIDDEEQDELEEELLRQEEEKEAARIKEEQDKEAARIKEEQAKEAARKKEEQVKEAAHKKEEQEKEAARIKEEQSKDPEAERLVREAKEREEARQRLKEAQEKAQEELRLEEEAAKKEAQLKRKFEEEQKKKAEAEESEEESEEEAEEDSFMGISIRPVLSIFSKLL